MILCFLILLKLFHQMNIDELKKQDSRKGKNLSKITKVQLFTVVKQNLVLIKQEKLHKIPSFPFSQNKLNLNKKKNSAMSKSKLEREATKNHIYLHNTPTVKIMQKQISKIQYLIPRENGPSQGLVEEHTPPNHTHNTPHNLEE